MVRISTAHQKPDKGFYTTSLRAFTCPHCTHSYTVTLFWYEDISICPHCHRGSNQKVTAISPEVMQAIKKPAIQAAKDIVLVGIGGVGGNTINNLAGKAQDDPQFPFALMVVSSDAGALEHSLCDNQIYLGNITAPAKPMLGKALAETALPQFMKAVAPYSDVIFVGGLGGGTGSGAMPVFAAEAAKTKKVKCVILTPFAFEGQERKRIAQDTIKEMTALQLHFIVVDNQELFKVADKKTTFADAFRIMDKAVYNLCMDIAHEGFDSAQPPVLNLV